MSMTHLVLKTSFLVISITSCIFLSCNNSDANYEASVLKHRDERESYMRMNGGSPFVLEEMDASMMSYFPINEEYKVTAKVEKLKKRQLVLIQNNDGSSLQYLKYAWLHFKINGKKQKLMLLKPISGVGFFLGFTDDTSGDSSYGGGRYLNIGEINDDRVTLDFNLTYNPYCAYSEKYQCPFPPKENILEVKIEAGEKEYGK